MKKVLILASAPTTVRESQLNKGHVLRSYHDMHIELDPEHRVLDVKSQKVPVTTFDLVYFRTSVNDRSIALPLAVCIDMLNVPVIDSALLATLSTTKSYQYAAFYKNNLPFPHTFIAYTDRLRKIEPLLRKKLQYPFIIKAVGGRKGEDNFLIKDKAHFFEVTSRYEPEILFIAQKNIPNDFDYRILTIGYKAGIVYKRIRDKGSDTHLNNVSQGGSREIVDPKTVSHLIKLAAKASSILKREVCGVDVVVDKETGKPYILEANAAPQINYPPALKAVRDYLESK